MRILAPLLVLFLVLPLPADEPKTHRGLPYADPKNERQMLDVYAPTQGKNLPVVVWIHGGGWRRGNKEEVHSKPKAFVDKGFVLVSINYRFVPNVTVKEIASDVAKAIRWTHDHAKDYGGDPNTIIVAGHSAGAQLAALVCTDDKYLKAEKLPLSIIKACVPVDGDTYDVALQIKTVEQKRADSYKMTFGDEASQTDLSSVTHVAKGKNIPPFLILHIADHPETKAQSQRLVKVLQEAGIPARAYPAEGKNHATINNDLGLLDDGPTQEMWAFLAQALKKEQATGKAVNGLQLSLVADKTEIVFKDGKVRDAAALKLTFTNVSDKAIKFNAFDFHFSRIKGEVKALPADSVQIQRLAPGRLPVAPKAGDFPEIKPGQSWSYDKQLGFPGSLPEGVSMFAIYSVTSPGEFWVTFTYNSPKGNDSPLAKGIWTGELVSNEIVITVKK